jgi:predicted ATPase
MMKNIPRIEYLKVQNYRALHNLELKNLTPLTVFLGPNGSGKSTIFDVFAFLSECFTESLRKAWDRRGRFRELRTRDSEGCIIIELKYRETSASPLITYHLAIDEENNRPFIPEEWLHWRRGQSGKPFRFLDFKKGEGQVISGESPDEERERITEKLASPEFLAVNTLGQFAKHPRVSALRRFYYRLVFIIFNRRSYPQPSRSRRTGKIISHW